MIDAMEQALQILAEARRCYPKDLKKVRIDRLSKMMPKDLTFMEWQDDFLSDPRIKQVKVMDSDGVLHLAVQLHYETYKKLIKKGGKLV